MQCLIFTNSVGNAPVVVAQSARLRQPVSDPKSRENNFLERIRHTKRNGGRSTAFGMDGRVAAALKEINSTIPLPVALGMVSHIDDDHINGIQSLTSTLVAATPNANAEMPKPSAVLRRKSGASAKQR